jgi:hypothetical protein
LEEEASLSRLEVAAERLAKALESLEQAVHAKAPDTKAVTGLKTERERLVARVAELEEEARSLSGLTEEVENRLDGAIAEIRAALGR